MANLLLHIESFAWHDLTVDRAQEMDDFMMAVDAAQELEDTIFGHPDGYSLNLGWGSLHDLICCTEEERRVFTRGWFSDDHQTYLIKVWRNPTHNQAKNLIEMEQDEAFKGANNGLIGCHHLPLPEKMVHDEMSLYKLHQNYTWNNPGLRITNPEYFYKHYRPALRQSVGDINAQISQRRVHSIFKRLDTPNLGPDGTVLHGEKVGMHFTDNKDSCLYIDGTWKHGGFEIPKQAADQLENWGFLLPEDQLKSRP